MIEPRPHVPTDPELESYEQRAAALARDVPAGPDALVRSAAVNLPEQAGRSLDRVRTAFSLDDARHVIAREHGAADWAAFARQVLGLSRGEAREPLRDAALAARAGEPENVTELLRRHPQILEQRGTHGHTLLGLAIIAATNYRAIPPCPASPEVHEVVRVLLAAGADVDAAADHGWTPLHTAGLAGHAELARTLLDAGASVHARAWETDGATPLAHALFYAHRDAAAVLARDIAAPDNLRTAAALGRLERLREFFLADGSLRPSAGGGRGFYRPLFLFPRWTPSDDHQEWLDEAVSWAARSGRIETMAELVARGAEIDSNAYRGTPLLWATYADRADAAQWLLDHGAEPSLRHDFGGAGHGGRATALHLAAQYGCLSCLRLLLERGADATIEDDLHHSTPLGWAEFAGQTEAAAILRAHGGGEREPRRG